VISRRVIALVATAAFALLPGCGDDGDKPSQGQIAESIGYLPKDSALVVAFDTDRKSGQYKNIDRVLGRFAFGGQVKNQLRQLYARGGRDYDRDIAPLMGNPVVIGSADTETLLRGDSRGALLIAWKTKDADKMRKAIEGMGQARIGTIEGADAYQAPDGFVSTARGDQFVGSYSRPLLAEALKTHGGPGKMSEADLDADFQGLPENGILRVAGDTQALLGSDPQTAPARKVKWVRGLRRFATTVNVEGDGIAVDGQVATEGVDPGEGPIAAGDAPPPVARIDLYSAALRTLPQTIHFVEDTLKAARPDSFARYQARKKRFAREVGIDPDSELFDQLGDASVATGQDGKASLRSTVKEPAVVRAALAKMGRAGRVGDNTLSVEDGFVKVAGDGAPTYYGMVGDVFVLGPSPAAARRLAAAPVKTIDGTHGAFALVADGEQIANAILKQSGRGGSAALFTGPIGDLTAWAAASPTGLRGHVKLKIK
jgi:hypothetical protein